MKTTWSSNTFQVVLTVALAGAFVGSPIPAWAQSPSNVASRHVGQTDQCSWSEEFNLPSFDGEVLASVVWDDGSGPALFVGGAFRHHGTQSIDFIARWDGQNWTPVTEATGLGVDATVSGLVVFDDGTGEALYVSGEFETAGSRTASRIARWDGSSWSALTGPMGNGVDGPLAAMTVYDDGNGEALYVGGTFESAGGIAAENIARWTGERWQTIPAIGGSPFDAAVVAMTVFDGRLAVAGAYEVPPWNTPPLLATWKGAWSTIEGIEFNEEDPIALTVLDDGSGGALYLGGRSVRFSGGPLPDVLARWDGSRWTSVVDSHGWGLVDLLEGFPVVMSMAASEGPGGPGLWVGGEECLIRNYPSCSNSAFVARWDGASWTLVADGAAGVVSGGMVATITPFDDDSSVALYAGGLNLAHGDDVFGGVGRWDGSVWTALSGGAGAGVSGGSGNASVLDFALFDDGFGETLYTAGFFAVAGDVPARGIARWNGTAWDPLVDLKGNGACAALDCERIFGMEVFDDGAGDKLIAATWHSCGYFSTTVELASWDGVQWRHVFSFPCDREYFSDMTVYDDGAGPSLYVAGEISLAGRNHLVRFDGQQWFRLDGLYWDEEVRVRALEAWDDGRGEALFIAGDFSRIASVEANSIIRWDGRTWSVVGGPFGAGVIRESTHPGTVTDMAAFDDGTGEALYVAGSFSNAGGVSVNNIAKWDGHRWWPLRGQPQLGTNGGILSLGVYNDGRGAALYAAGSFSIAGEVNVDGFAKWDGQRWSAVCPGPPTGASNGIYRFIAHDDGNGESLFVGGSFSEICGFPSSGIARLTCPRFDFGDAPDPPYPTLFSNDGPRHALVSGFNLGGNASEEPDGRPSVHSDADDFDDGVFFLDPLIPGFASRVKIASPAEAILDGWIDFNADGDWDDPGERIFDHHPVPMGANSQSFTVPPTAVVGAVSVARFRLSSTGTAGPTGVAPDGEVEDYEIEITPIPTRQPGGRVLP